MFEYPEKFDVIVAGGGHAGCEASLASARMGMKTLLVTMNIDTIGAMSCNPALGGLGKGQLVREIDALGGEMGKAADRTAMQFRMLNMSMGPAVRSSRVQVDRHLYRDYMKSVIERQPNLQVKQGTVEEVLSRGGAVSGIRTSAGERYGSGAVILCPGTFLRGLIHIGMLSFPGGRLGEAPSEKLAGSLEELGIRLGTFKTGTCPRIDGRSIDFSILKIQPGDESPVPFSSRNPGRKMKQVPCYLTRTVPETHRVIRDNLDSSPLYGGVIKSTGVRYCPSIEDKVVKFPQRESHHIFLEPEGRKTCEFYPNGLSTSLPVGVQFEMLRTIPGLENARITRPGYGIEHCYADPTLLRPSLESKMLGGLFLAGQINGTTGYEEAASQGILAGINAALLARGEPALKLDRSGSYIGVMVDDLVTRGTDEPYRMFTSRAEYRLLLREDNAALRLGKTACELGLAGGSCRRKIEKIEKGVRAEMEYLEKTTIPPGGATPEILARLGAEPARKPSTLAAILRRPGVSYRDLALFVPEKAATPPEIARQVEILVKYGGYIKRQEKEAEKFKQAENMLIPPETVYAGIPSVSNELKEKLSRIRPVSLGQASRIPGMTPAALSALMVYIKKKG